MVMSLQEAALRTLSKNPEDLEKALAEFSIEDSSEESSDMHPIASAARKVLKEVYGEVPLDPSVDSVTQFSTTRDKIQKLKQSRMRPVNWNKPLASIYVEIRFQDLLCYLKNEIEGIRRGRAISREEFAAVFGCNEFRSPEARKKFLQQAIERLDLEQFALRENERIPGIQRLLFVSASSNYWEGVQELVDQEICVNFQNPSYRETALHYAARNNSLESMRVLIAAGAEVNIRDHQGETSLYRAVYNGHQDAVAELIAAGADPDIPDFLGHTPLYCAMSAIKPPLEIVSVLLQAGANPKLSSYGGETPLSLAKKRGSEEAVQMLSDAIKRYGDR